MTIAAIVSPAGAWELETAPFPAWGDSLRSLGGEFFQSPNGLQVGAPPGTPIYLRYVLDGALAGIAIGVRVNCRLSLRPRHAYFPSWPVFAPGVDQEKALARLTSALRDEALAEVAWDSFDGGWTSPVTVEPARYEYVLPLDGVDDSVEWVEGTQHRRSVRRGDRAGLVMRRLEGQAAADALGQVLVQASARAAQRGIQFAAQVPEIVSAPAYAGGDWGVATYAAMQGDDLRAAVLVGHGPTRAYYLLGGATPEGYDLGASIWLHARIAATYAAGGWQEYNLGGVPVTAIDPTDPSHGLHRFKQGFGGRMVACTGGRWNLGPVHSAGHRFARWATKALR